MKKISWDEAERAISGLEEAARKIAEVSCKIQLDEQPVSVKRWFGYCFSGCLPTHGDALIKEAARLCSFAAYEAVDREELRTQAMGALAGVGEKEKVFTDESGRKWKCTLVEEE